MIRKAFTLLEIMIAICLFAIAGSWISFKMHGAIERKKFQSDVDRFKNELITAQKLAIAMQADWHGALTKEKKGWIVYLECQENREKKLKPLHLGECDIFVQGKKVGKLLAFDFFSSGHTNLEGTLILQKGSYQEKLQMEDLFQRGQKI